MIKSIEAILHARLFFSEVNVYFDFHSLIARCAFPAFDACSCEGHMWCTEELVDYIKNEGASGITFLATRFLNPRLVHFCLDWL